MTSINSSITVTCAVVVASSVLVACATSNPKDSTQDTAAAKARVSTPTPVGVHGDDYYAISDTVDTDACMEALFTGTLEIDDQGCLILRAEGERADKTVPLWPKGTVLSSDSVTLPDNTVLKIGNKVSLGGGSTKSEILLSKAKERCQINDVYVVCKHQ